MIRVLIMDDSALARERLTGTLFDLPEVEVVGQAENGEEALEFIQKLTPDVVILDIRMPGRNGIELLPYIQRISPVPVTIMFSSYSFPQYREKSIAAGADYFFHKSTEFEKIAELLKHLNQKLKSESVSERRH